MRLGKLIERLEELDPKAQIQFDTGEIPDNFISWRGVYAELAIERDGKKPQAVASLLAKAKNADGDTFHGYKGGDYVMDAHTLVWADNYGDYTSTAISGVEMRDNGIAIIRTLDMDDYR